MHLPQVNLLYSLEDFLDRFQQLPTWTQWFTGTLMVFAVSMVFGGLPATWGEKYFISAFAEGTIAVVGYVTTLIAPIAAGVWAGGRAEKYSDRTVRWFISILVWAALGLIMVYVFESIPGVDWRFDRLMDSVDGIN